MPKVCELCPRRCGAERGMQPGRCHAPATLRVARAAAHFGEEPCISGIGGSGAVFFAGCPLGCCYCQNFELSRARQGAEITPERLSEIFAELEDEGVHNINLVTGTQYVPQIIRALELHRPGVPVVWNSSGYERVETIRALAPYIDVWMPDFKYALRAPAEKYSRAPDYPQVAMAAIGEMFRLAGPYQLDADELLTRGVLLRHLVLPGNLPNTRAVIDWVSQSFAAGDILFSLMAQYTPMGEVGAFPELQRGLTEGEWDTVMDWLNDSPIADGFVQELGASGTEAIPAFDGTGVL